MSQPRPAEESSGPDGPPPPPAYPPPPPDYPRAGQSRAEDTTWAVLGHLSFFVLGLIAPLVILLTVGERSPFVRGHAAEALNFHITVLIASAVSFLLIFVLVGFLLLPAW